MGVASDVTSPTFTLIHEYPGKQLPLFHIDLYRLEQPEEALNIGLEEYLGSSGVTVIEWGDKFPALMPAPCLWVRIEVLEGDQRRIHFQHS